MKLERAFELMNNFDVPESMKKRAPKWSIIFVGAAGKVMDVVRFYEEYPKPIRRLDEYREQHRGAICYFIAKPGQCDYLDKLEKKIKSCFE